MKKHVILLVQEAIRINSISTLNRFFFLYKFFCVHSLAGKVGSDRREGKNDGCHQRGAVLCFAKQEHLQAMRRDLLFLEVRRRLRGQ